MLGLLGLSFVLIGTFLCSYLSFVEQGVFYFLAYSLSFIGLVLSNNKEWNIREVLLTCSVLCLFFLGTEPVLSDDAYRYLAEARASLNGINPYLVSPDSYSFTDSIVKKVNHPEYSAIYPPMFQLLMSSIVSLSYSMFFLQFVCILAFVSIVFICHKLEFKKIINIAWNPFFIIEGCWHCHIEIFIALFLFLSLLCMKQEREKLSSLLYGVAIALKFIPLVLVPIYFLRLKRKAYILISFLPLIFSFLFYRDSFKDIFTSLFVYMGNWEFASPLFKFQQYLGISKDIIKIDLLLLYFLFTFVILVLFYKKKLTFLQSVAMQYFLYPFFTAVVYPWYLLPSTLLLLCFEKSTIAYAVFLFYSFVSYFSYSNIPQYIKTSKWEEPVLALGVNAIVLFLMSIYLLLNFKQKKA